jgi:hypothetical protein
MGRLECTLQMRIDPDKHDRLALRTMTLDDFSDNISKVSGIATTH